MKKCIRFHKLIWLAVYDEISAANKKDLEAHIHQCPECQLDFYEAEQTKKSFNEKIQIQPTDLQLETSRAELRQRLLLLTQPKIQKQWLAKLWRIVSLDFAPSLRFASAIALLIIGIFLGRAAISPINERIESDQLKISELVQSNINNIHSIQYDPKTRQVAIKLNTLNEVSIQGDVAQPEIQQLLLETLRTEERPDVKIKTVAALQHTKFLNKDVIKALSNLIEKEQNPGIRLKAVKLLTTIPITSSIKEILAQVLIRVLLNDSNSAIRIEAFKGLSKFDNGATTSIIFNAARNDSSEYIRNKARQILERTENPIIAE